MTAPAAAPTPSPADKPEAKLTPVRYEHTVNFVELLPVLLASQPTVIPEIWMGHH